MEDTKANPATNAGELRNCSYYERQVKQAVSAGQLLIAIELAKEGLIVAGESLLLRQQLALALVQTGAIDVVLKELEILVNSGARDEETLCRMGRVYKEIWRQSADASDKTNAVSQMNHYYGEAFERYKHYYGGINLAYGLALSGQRTLAEQCAREVAGICHLEAGEIGTCQDAWLLASLGEASLHLGDQKSAVDCYRRAASLLKGHWRDLSSMRQQARELLCVLKGDGQTLDQCWEMPSVVAFVGHMLDHPARPEPRFPAALENSVREQIQAHLKSQRAGFGFASAACGGDILFAECLLEQGGELHLILPFPLEVFKTQSVSFAGPHWEKRVDQVVARATSINISNPLEAHFPAGHSPSPVAYLFSNRILTGTARLQARSLGLELKTLALWDGKAGGGIGGTASAVTEWSALGLNPVVIHPELTPKAVKAGKASSLTGPTIPPPAPVGLGFRAMQQDIKIMLFADVVGYSQIGEVYVKPYVEEFMRRVSQLIADSPYAPVIINTWGDAFYMVFDTARQGASFALALRDLVRTTDWTSLALPSQLNIRIALHAGSVFAFVDPVIRQVSFTGAHVTRAARIEPVTAPGQIYVSQEFAALCAVEGTEGMSFEYLGRLPAAKKYGDAPLYRLDWDHARISGGIGYK